MVVGQWVRWPFGKAKWKRAVTVHAWLAFGGAIRCDDVPKPQLLVDLVSRLRQAHTTSPPGQPFGLRRLVVINGASVDQLTTNVSWCSFGAVASVRHTEGLTLGT